MGNTFAPQSRSRKVNIDLSEGSVYALPHEDLLDALGKLVLGFSPLSINPKTTPIIAKNVNLVICNCKSVSKLICEYRKDVETAGSTINSAATMEYGLTGSAWGDMNAIRHILLSSKLVELNGDKIERQTLLSPIYKLTKVTNDNTTTLSELFSERPELMGRLDGFESYYYNVIWSTDNELFVIALPQCDELVDHINTLASADDLLMLSWGIYYKMSTLVTSNGGKVMDKHDALMDFVTKSSISTIPCSAQVIMGTTDYYNNMITKLRNDPKNVSFNYYVEIRKGMHAFEVETKKMPWSYANDKDFMQKFEAFKLTLNQLLELLNKSNGDKTYQVTYEERTVSDINFGTILHFYNITVKAEQQITMSELEEFLNEQWKPLRHNQMLSKTLAPQAKSNSILLSGKTEDIYKNHFGSVKDVLGKTGATVAEITITNKDLPKTIETNVYL